MLLYSSIHFPLVHEFNKLKERITKYQNIFWQTAIIIEDQIWKTKKIINQQRESYKKSTN